MTEGAKDPLELRYPSLKKFNSLIKDLVMRAFHSTLLKELGILTVKIEDKKNMMTFQLLKEVKIIAKYTLQNAEKTRIGEENEEKFKQKKVGSVLYRVGNDEAISEVWEKVRKENFMKNYLLKKLSLSKIFEIKGKLEILDFKPSEREKKIDLKIKITPHKQDGKERKKENEFLNMVVFLDEDRIPKEMIRKDRIRGEKVRDYLANKFLCTTLYCANCKKSSQIKSRILTSFWKVGIRNLLFRCATKRHAFKFSFNPKKIEEIELNRSMIMRDPKRTFSDHFLLRSLGLYQSEFNDNGNRIQLSIITNTVKRYHWETKRAARANSSIEEEEYTINYPRYKFLQIKLYCAECEDWENFNFSIDALLWKIRFDKVRLTCKQGKHTFLIDKKTHEFITEYSGLTNRSHTKGNQKLKMSRKGIKRRIGKTKKRNAGKRADPFEHYHGKTKDKKRKKIITENILKLFRNVNYKRILRFFGNIFGFFLLWGLIFLISLMSAKLFLKTTLLELLEYYRDIEIVLLTASLSISIIFYGIIRILINTIIIRKNNSRKGNPSNEIG